MSVKWRTKTREREKLAFEARQIKSFFIHGRVVKQKDYTSLTTFDITQKSNREWKENDSVCVCVRERERKRVRERERERRENRLSFDEN